MSQAEYTMLRNIKIVDLYLVHSDHLKAFTDHLGKITGTSSERIRESIEKAHRGVNALMR